MTASSSDSAQTAASGLETAILGGGCFWCLEAVYAEVVGVHAVIPGYCGGELEAPSYAVVCSGRSGHAEVVRIDFDPTQISFAGLLEIFFVIHDPTTLDRQGNDLGPQYRSVIFTCSAEQRAQALAMIAELEAQQLFDAPIVTAVEPASRFWPAEVEHHGYYARHAGQPYCQYVVAPKLARFRQHFSRYQRRQDGSERVE